MIYIWLIIIIYTVFYNGFIIFITELKTLQDIKYFIKVDIVESYETTYIRLDKMWGFCKTFFFKGFPREPE